MTDEGMKRLEELAKAAADSVGGHWKYIPAHGGVEGWVESETEGANIGTGYDGEWDGDAGMFSAAADPATVLALIERVRKAERKGAEEMREDVATFVEDASIPLPIENWQGTRRELTAHFARALAERIRQRHLPGDAP